MSLNCDLDPHCTVPTKDLEVDGGILLASLVLSNADVLSLVIFVHVPDSQLRTVIAEDVLVIILFLVFYGFSIPASFGNAKGDDSGHGVKRFISNQRPQNADCADGTGSVYTKGEDL